MKPENTFQIVPLSFEKTVCACSIGTEDGKKSCCKKYKKKGKFCGGCPKK